MMADEQDRDREKQDRDREKQDRDREMKEREAERKDRERQREVELYEQGQESMDQSRWDRAINAFDRVIELKGTKVDAALYWKAYSQNRQGLRAESLATIAELIKGYPNSRYLKDAKALEVEVRSAVGQAVRPENQADEELKLMALRSLQNADPEQAVPMLEKFLSSGTATPRLKAQALFVLAQTNSPRAREILKNLAKGSSTPELQAKAIQYLGVNGGRESRAVLSEVYSSTTDVDVKRRILRAFMTSGEKDRLMTAAQTEQNPELRTEAVRQLGAMGAHEELWSLYVKETSVDVKKQIISAMFVGGNATRLIELAKSEKDPELRRAAIRNLGVMGSKRTGDALVEIYGTEKDPAIKKTVINGLFTQGNATALVGIARKETDIEMKKEIVSRLSNMQDKVAIDYLLEILNK